MTATDEGAVPSHVRAQVAREAYGPKNRARLVQAEAKLLAAEQVVRNLDADLALRIGRFREAIASELRGELAP